MITMNQAGLGAIVALRRGVRVDGVLGAVFSPPLKLAEDGSPLDEQPEQPKGTVSGGARVNGSAGPVVVVDFGHSGWADVPFADLELVEAAPALTSTTAGGSTTATPSVTNDEATALRQALAEMSERVRVLEDAAVATADRAKLALDPERRYVTVGEIGPMITKRVENVVEAKTQGLRDAVSGFGDRLSAAYAMSERATDEVATLNARVDEAHAAIEHITPKAVTLDDLGLGETTKG